MRRFWVIWLTESVCTLCSGSGKVAQACPNCNGTGNFECPQCHGLGTCKNCNGTGQIPDVASARAGVLRRKQTVQFQKLTGVTLSGPVGGVPDIPPPPPGYSPIPPPPPGYSPIILTFPPVILDLPSAIKECILARFSQDSGAHVSDLDISGLQHGINGLQYGPLSMSQGPKVPVESLEYNNRSNELETVPFVFSNSTTLTDSYESSQSINFGVSVNIQLPVVPIGASANMSMSFSTKSTQTTSSTATCTSTFPVACEPQKTTKVMLYCAEMQAECTFQGWIQTFGIVKYTVHFGNTDAWGNVPIGQLFKDFWNPKVYVDDNTIKYYVSGSYVGMRAQAWTVDPFYLPLPPSGSDIPKEDKLQSPEDSSAVHD